MSEYTDPFDALLRPITPVRPRADFAARLRQQILEELGVSLIDDLAPAVGRSSERGRLALVHLAVADADRAMRFFGSLLDWESERALVGGYVSHYTLNTAVTVRLLEDPGAVPVRPNYIVDDVAEAIRAITSLGGEVTESDSTPDGGGWAFAQDDQGIPLLVFKPRDRPHDSPTREPIGDVDLLFMKADAIRVRQFYGGVLGWRLQAPHHPGSTYYDVLERVGLYDEAAQLGIDVAPELTLYVGVPTLAPSLSRIRALGGTIEPVPEERNMGPYFAVLCADDQGTKFGLMAPDLD
jgi:predicted enzyme related to lactoylglutathione lyase